MGHAKKDTWLSHQKDQDYGCQTSDSPEFYQHRQPENASGVNGQSYRIRNIEP